MGIWQQTRKMNSVIAVHRIFSCDSRAAKSGQCAHRGAITPPHPVLGRGTGQAGKRTLNGILRSGCATSGSTCSTGLTRVKKRMLPTMLPRLGTRGLCRDVRWQTNIYMWKKQTGGSAGHVQTRLVYANQEPAIRTHTQPHDVHTQNAMHHTDPHYCDVAHPHQQPGAGQGDGRTPEPARPVVLACDARLAHASYKQVGRGASTEEGEGGGRSSSRRAYAPALMLHRSHCMAVCCRSSRQVSTWVLAAVSFVCCAMYCSLRAAFSPWICCSARSSASR